MTDIATPIPAPSTDRPAPAPRVTRLPGLSIVLPCFNEQDNVAEAVREAVAAAQRISREHEIIVVDDGSSDRTAEVAARVAESLPGVRVIVHPVNRGYGGAVRTGIRAARMPWVFLTDADLQFDLTELTDFVPLTADHDLVIGWRITRQDPAHRRMNAAAWNWLVRRAFNLDVRDVDCAFKLVRRDVLDEMPLTSEGAMIDTELLVRALGAGARISEIGVHHHPRVAGESSGANARVVLRAFRELCGLRARLHRLPRRPARAPRTSHAAA
jgi:glycosyltransferase involved in cell wall biosynthesis